MTAIKDENAILFNDIDYFDRCCKDCYFGNKITTIEHVNIIECKNKASSYYRHLLSGYHYDCGHFD